MEQATQCIVESGLGNSPLKTGEPVTHEQAMPIVAEAVLEQADGDEIDGSLDVVYGDSLGQLLPSELRYLLMSWRAAA
jgi:hypothetical protein